MYLPIIETENFESFSREEYVNNLRRLNIPSHTCLVGTEVFYSKPIYGKHLVLEWNPQKAEYLLSLDGQEFWTNPFRIHSLA